MLYMASYTTDVIFCTQAVRAKRSFSREKRFVAKNLVGKKFSREKFGQEYTPGTAGGPGGRDRTLAVKSKQKR